MDGGRTGRRRAPTDLWAGGRPAGSSPLPCEPAAEAVDLLAVLGDAHRRKLFGYVRTARRPVTRDEAAAEVGISRKLAAFHLERLVEAGLLEPAPGSPHEAAKGRRPGRPAKTYQAADVAISVSIPERRYELLALLLTDAITRQRPGESTTGATLRAAHEAGEQMGHDVASDRRLGRVGPERGLAVAAEMLTSLGFEPVEDSGSPRRLHLANCAFKAAAVHAPELVCGVNRSFVEGLLEGLGTTGVRVDLSPRPDACCLDLEIPAASG